MSMWRVVGIVMVVLGASVAATAGGDDDDGSVHEQPPAAHKGKASRSPASPRRAKGPVQASTIEDAWQMLPLSGSACGNDLIFDYGADGGMRNFFCRALTVYSWKAFLKAAPTKPFRSGPHKGGKLDLQNARSFGRYDPTFVRWATTALVPAAKDSALRTATQDTYDVQVRKLARLYFLVDKALGSDPSWRAKETKLMMDAADNGTLAEGEVTWFWHDVLGDSAGDWGGHDPNHVRAATAWWLRRHHDGTSDLWREGLVRLLSTYDDAWLAAARQQVLPALPQRAKAAEPEYR
jgi:hypothetical protein